MNIVYKSLIGISMVSFFVLTLIPHPYAVATTQNPLASVKDQDGITSMLEQIEKVDPLAGDEEDLLTLELREGDTLGLDQDGFTTDIDMKNKEVVLGDEYGDTVVKIPKGKQSEGIFDTYFNKPVHVGNKVIFPNYTEGYSTIVESIDGGFRQLIYMESEKAPKSYEFEMKLAEGDTIEQDEDGSIQIKSESGELKQFVPKPWAKDADGNELDTHYEIVDSSIVQHIDTEDAVYPVTADPMWCSRYISYVRWVYRNIYSSKYDWSLNIKETLCGRMSKNPT